MHLKTLYSIVDFNLCPYCTLSEQGAVWILDSAKVPKGEKVSKEQKRKKELFEVSPVRKHAKINNREFTLTDLDGSSTIVNLKGCIVEAVSATNLPSRKW